MFKWQVGGASDVTVSYDDRITGYPLIMTSYRNYKKLCIAQCKLFHV